MASDILKDAETRMKKSIESAGNDFSTLRTGRANPAILDSLKVEYYGQMLPINQVAAVASPDPRALLITPWDKGAMRAIEKAIINSDLGMVPNNDGVNIRLNIPALTEERRKQLVKLVHNHVEEGKVAVRNIRRDAMGNVRELMNERMISEDDERRAEHQVDDLAKRFVDEADKIGKAKEQEVLEV